MKLRTSCFKPVTLKKDILRFAPVWALYFIGMMLILLGNGYSDYSRFAKYTLTPMLPAFGIVNLGYALVIGMLLFGDLFNTKMCYSLHAMPYRRESWLATHLLAGLLFSLVPNTIACLYLMTRLEGYWFLALLWLLAVTLQFLFFFGIAALSAMLTGSRFAMLAVYGILNFVSMLLYANIMVIYQPMLQGVVFNAEDFTRFSPVVELISFQFFRFEEKRTLIQGSTQYVYHYLGLGTGWGYTAILAAVGLAAMGAAFWLYRKRQLECAGDFVAFAKLKGIFCIILTLCVTLCFALLGQVMDALVLWMLVGLFVGFFGSLMLLERRLKVFRKKTFLGYVALVIAAALTLCAAEFDWLDIESWTPRPQQVKSVQVSNSSQYNYGYDYMGRLSATLEDPADIDRIIQAHEDILDRLDERTPRHRVTLVYTLRSGRKVVRSYMAPASGTNYEIVRQYLYRAENVLGFTDAQTAAGQIRYFHCNKGPVPPALYEKLLEALQSDFANGAIGLDDYGPNYLEYEIRNAYGSTEHHFLNITEKAEKTLSLLDSPEFVMGYSDWQSFLEGVQELTIEDGESYPVTGQKQATLLEALRKDIEAGNIDADRYISGVFVIHYRNLVAGEYAYREFYITDQAQHVWAWLMENHYTAAG